MKYNDPRKLILDLRFANGAPSHITQFGNRDSNFKASSEIIQ